MTRCRGITNKGERCPFSALAHGLCGIHAQQEMEKPLTITELCAKWDADYQAMIDRTNPPKPVTS